jgi:O-succinylbenzoic acid--CoA ligase
VDDSEALWIKSPMSGPLPIQTNDRVALLTNNTFQWLGRVDFVINSGGVKIHPEILEAKSSEIIEKFFPESQFFYTGIKDEKLGEKVVLILEGTETANPRIADLKNNLKAELKRFENPKEIFFVNSFIRTQSGKLDRNKTVQQL